MSRVRSTTSENEEILLDNYTPTNDVIDASSFAQFDAVVNHLFDNVFVYFNEGTKKDVVQIIWTTLPSDIYIRYYNRNDRWSRDCILEAFRENENCLSGAIEESINNLINCKNIPYVSDAVTVFLTKRRNKTLSLSGTKDVRSGSLLNTSRDATKTIISDCEVNDRQTKAYLKRLSRKNIKIADDDLKKGGFFLGHWYTMFVAIFVILVLFLITFYMLYKIHLKLTEIPYQDKSVYVNETQHNEGTRNMKIRLPNDPPGPEIFYPSMTSVVVRNYNEYKHAISTLSFGQEINLIISIKNPQDWPDYAVLNITANIVDLSILGAVSNANIFRILSIAPKIQSLVIGNLFDYVCTSEKTENLYNGTVISLPALEAINIENLTECTIFYEKLVKHTLINNLHTFRLSRSVVTENNLGHLQNFIRRSKNNVASLEFPETAWNAPIFDYHIGTLDKLQYIHIDFIYKSSERIFSINKYIDIFFPNLISFTSSYGYLPITKFQNLSDCKNLKYLKVRVLIPESQTEIQLSTMKSYFPRLLNATLYFKFESWESRNECSIEGIEDIKAKVSNLKIRSNCPMAT